MPLKEGHNYMLYAIKTQFSLIQNTSPNLYLAKYKLYLAKYKPYLAKYRLGEVLCSLIKAVLLFTKSRFIAYQKQFYCLSFLVYDSLTMRI